MFLLESIWVRATKVCRFTLVFVSVSVGAGLPAMQATRSVSDTEVMPSRASPAPTGKSSAGRHRAFYPDWRDARTGTGHIQHRRFTALQGYRLHVADLFVTVIQRQADFHRVDFALATAFGGHRLDHVGLAVGGLQGQDLVAEVLHAYQGFLLVLERRFFDQLWLAAAAVNQGVVVVGGEFDRHGLAADLGAVVAARHEAEVAAGQRCNVVQVGGADGSADFLV